eukprot:15296637-Heterocapsa_arctica.AAC.1
MSYGDELDLDMADYEYGGELEHELDEFKTDMADFEYDVEFGQDEEFQEVYAAFINARKDLTRSNPQRKYVGT